MEEPTLKSNFNNGPGRTDSTCIDTNWILAQDNKRLNDVVAITTTCTESLTWEEIATEDSCVVLQPANANIDAKPEACVIDIVLAGQKVSRIGIVSEASVLEFFKDSGEYAGTVFAELIDEYEGATVYFAQLKFPRPTVQASVKFTRINNNSRSNMYLYGIKLVVEDDRASSSKRHTFENIFENTYRDNGSSDKNGISDIPDLTNISNSVGDFSTRIDACLRGFMEKAWLLQNGEPSDKQDTPTSATPLENQRHTDETNENFQSTIELYIAKKFEEMEKRLNQRIGEAETKINKKLDRILCLMRCL